MIQNMRSSERNVALAIGATRTINMPSTLRATDSGSQVRAHYISTQSATLSLEASVDSTNWVQVAVATAGTSGQVTFPALYPHYRALVTNGATAGTLTIFGVGLFAA